ncbi:Hint domain-containing protein [Tateyamaria sp.]|uniref:Hint domain-containing protein n=1 Tax=Tateyamaria sp. TaxID=1929288 RepID=UPI00329D0185
MAIFYGYTFALLGSQTTVNGATADYNFAPNGTWSYSGDSTYFVVNENDGATVFNGDSTSNETIQPQERFDGAFPQTTDIDGTDRQLIWDYTFTVTDGTTTWRIAVIDVDLNNDDDVQDAGEDGYYLVFPDGLPPADTDLTTGGITDNGAFIPHADLGAQIVCFTSGTLIETPNGPRKIEDIAPDDIVTTAHNGAQSVKWAGQTTVAANDDLAPIVITAGTLGNASDLVVSPQHAILLNDWRAELLFGEDQVLVRAVELLGMDGVYRKTGGIVTYCHILMDSHQLVQAHGLWSETLYPGAVAMGAVNDAARDEILRLFPDLSAYGPMAAPCLRGYEARLLAA